MATAPFASSSPDSHRRSFAAIEAYRGLAALAVAAGHAVAFFHEASPHHFYLAVDFFFMLSGIVMAYSYDGRFGDGRLATGSFVKLRAIRLYPVIVAATLFAGVVHAFILAAHSTATPYRDVPSLLVATVLTAALIPQPWSGEYYPLNGPFWSLLFELLVNVLFAFAWRWLHGKRLVALIAASAVAIVILTPAAMNFEQGFHLAYAPLAVARTIFGFFVGVFIARHRHAAPIDSNFWVVAGAVLLAIVFGVATPAGLPFDTIATLLLLPPIAFLAVRFEPVGLIEKIARFLGKASYPLYAFNLPAVLLVAALVKVAGLRDRVPGVAIGVAFLVALTIVAFAIDRLFDEPVRAALKRFFARRRAGRERGA